MKCAALARKEKVDFIIGLGGGSRHGFREAIALASPDPTYLGLTMGKRDPMKMRPSISRFRQWPEPAPK